MDGQAVQHSTHSRRTNVADSRTPTSSYKRGSFLLALTHPESHAKIGTHYSLEEVLSCPLIFDAAYDTLTWELGRRPSARLIKYGMMAIAYAVPGAFMRHPAYKLHDQKLLDRIKLLTTDLS